MLYLVFRYLCILSEYVELLSQDNLYLKVKSVLKSVAWYLEMYLFELYSTNEKTNIVTSVDLMPLTLNTLACYFLHIIIMNYSITFALVHV